MDDVYRINLAKTEFREAYQEGDVDRLLKVFGGRADLELTPKNGNRGDEDLPLRCGSAAIRTDRRH